MKHLTLALPDDVYQDAERRAAAQGLTLQKHILDLVSRDNCSSEHGETESPQIAAAKARMEELFRSVTSFQFDRKIPREELYERGSLS